MGGLVIEKVRSGVEFVPGAAAAFRRAEAQVQREFGRNIDVNSTYRDWDTQLRMYNAWQAYITGRGPYPGHSKALHPTDPLSFHTKGAALDSDDWRNATIVQILAVNGFIRNRLYIPNEQHHFEYIRALDNHLGKPAGGNSTPHTPAPVPADLMEAIRMAQIRYVHRIPEKNNPTEWMIVGIEIPGGFMTTTDQEEAVGWGAVYGTDKGDSWKGLNRQTYIKLQQSAAKLHNAWAAMQKKLRS